MKEPNKSILNWRKNSTLYFNVGLVVSLLLVTTAFEWRFEKAPLKDVYIPDDNGGIIIDLTHVEIPDRPQVPPKVKTLPSPTLAIDHMPKRDDIIIDIPEIETGSIPDIGNLFTGKPDSAVEITQPLIESTTAAPKEGMESFYSYLMENIEFPSYMRNTGATAKITVAFTVDEEGKISDVKVVKGVSKYVDKQIVEVFENAPAWEPATQNARRVKNRMMIPIAFLIK